MTEPWHYTTFLYLLDHWQALVAGVLGFAAAIGVVWVTLRIEQRKLQRELEALRKSLAIELRQQVLHALRAGSELRKLASSPSPITARMLQSLASVSVPMVYPAIADRIGLLGPDAMDVVIVYSLIESGRGGVTMLINSRDPDNIDSNTIAATADAFLSACAYAQSVLPKIRTGVTEHDQRDVELIERIREATA